MIVLGATEKNAVANAVVIPEIAFCPSILSMNTDSAHFEFHDNSIDSHGQEMLPGICIEAAQMSSQVLRMNQAIV